MSRHASPEQVQKFVESLSRSDHPDYCPCDHCAFLEMEAMREVEGNNRVATQALLDFQALLAKKGPR